MISTGYSVNFLNGRGLLENKMATIITMLSFQAVMFLSLFCGVFIAYHTCEELAIIEKILNFMKYLLSICGFLIVDYLLFGLSIAFFFVGIAVFVFAAIIYGIRNYYSISRKEFIRLKRIMEMLTLASLMSFFAIRNNAALASVIFILGIVIGTIETKRYLFSVYDRKKFTTLTAFSLKEKYMFYVNVLKEYHWALYPAVITMIFTLAI